VTKDLLQRLEAAASHDEPRGEVAVVEVAGEAIRCAGIPRPATLGEVVGGSETAACGTATPVTGT
jgi:hypothetical protein